MRLPEDFKEYLKKGIIRKISPDTSRANFLINEAENSMQGLKEIISKIGVNEKNSNSIIKNCYDIIMELVRAKLLSDGYNSSGSYAHEAEVSYMKVLEFSENETGFMNELRYFRNSIAYYGKILNKEYAVKVLNFLNRIYPKLSNILKT